MSIAAEVFDLTSNLQKLVVADRARFTACLEEWDRAAPADEQYIVCSTDAKFGYSVTPFLDTGLYDCRPLGIEQAPRYTKEEGEAILALAIANSRIWQKFVLMHYRDALTTTLSNLDKEATRNNAILTQLPTHDANGESARREPA